MLRLLCCCSVDDASAVSADGVVVGATVAVLLLC